MISIGLSTRKIKEETSLQKIRDISAHLRSVNDIHCVRLIDSPLTKNRDNFLTIGPFFMFLSAFERHGYAAHYAFNFIKKYFFL